MTSSAETVPSGGRALLLLGRGLLRAWLFPAVALTIFLLLAAAVCREERPYFALDLAVSRWVQSISWPGFTGLMQVICQVDNDALRASVGLSVACFLLVAHRAWREALGLLVGMVFGRRRKRSAERERSLWREAVVLVGVVLVGQGLWLVSGQIVNRPRPDSSLVTVLIDAKDVAGFPSFPSGHAVHYTVFFGFLWFLTWTWVKPAVLRWPLLVVLGCLVVLVGPGRIYLGAHWFSDVLGGYLLGSAVLATGINLYRCWPSRGATMNTDEKPSSPQGEAEVPVKRDGGGKRKKKRARRG
jgi:membrane-associated phospholipid phosphatase